ncbi:MAG: ATP-binding protein [Caldilineaceae bacterium]|nr:ATP-binding protein [Caldilineaceae bacterium]
MQRNEIVILAQQKMDLSITPAALSTLQTALGNFGLQIAPISENWTDQHAAEIQFSILAATMEIAENIVRHAYPIPNAENWLRVELSLFVDSVEVVLSDGGRAFEPRTDSGDLSCLWERTKPGGWGLLLARQAVDRFSYHRENRINYWRLVKVNDFCGV